MEGVTLKKLPERRVRRFRDAVAAKFRLVDSDFADAQA